MFDERALYLEVSRAGGKWWRLKYRFDGKVWFMEGPEIEASSSAAGPQAPAVERNYLRKKVKQANQGALG
jgi:hypothetical protein